MPKRGARLPPYRNATTIHSDQELLDYYPPAYNALLRVQANVRGVLARRQVLAILHAIDAKDVHDDSRWKVQHVAACNIQRCWRGVVARQEAREMLKQLSEDKQMQQRFLTSLTALEQKLVTHMKAYNTIYSVRLSAEDPSGGVRRMQSPIMRGLPSPSASPTTKALSGMWDKDWRAKQLSTPDQSLPTITRPLDSTKWSVPTDPSTLSDTTKKPPQGPEAELYIWQLQNQQRALDAEKFMVQENQRRLESLKQKQAMDQKNLKQRANLQWAEECIRRELRDAYHDSIDAMKVAYKDHKEKALRRQLQREESVRFLEKRRIQSDYENVQAAMQRMDREAIEDDERRARERLEKKLFTEWDQLAAELRTMMAAHRQHVMKRHQDQIEEEERAFQRELLKMEFNQRTIAFEGFLAEQRKKAAISLNRMMVVLENQLRDLQELESVHRALIVQNASAAFDKIVLANMQTQLDVARTSEVEHVTLKLAKVQAEVELVRQQLDETAKREAKLRRKEKYEVTSSEGGSSHPQPSSIASPLAPTTAAASGSRATEGSALFVSRVQNELVRWIPLLQVMEHKLEEPIGATTSGEPIAFPNPTLTTVVTSLEAAVTGNAPWENEPDGFLATPRVKTYEELGKVLALELVQRPDLPVRVVLRELARQLAQNAMERAQDADGTKKAQRDVRKMQSMETAVVAKVADKSSSEMPTYALDILRQTAPAYAAGLNVLYDLMKDGPPPVSTLHITDDTTSKPGKAKPSVREDLFPKDVPANEEKKMHSKPPLAPVSAAPASQMTSLPALFDASDMSPSSPTKHDSIRLLHMALEQQQLPPKPDLPVTSSSRSPSTSEPPKRPSVAPVAASGGESSRDEASDTNNGVANARKSVVAETPSATQQPQATAPSSPEPAPTKISARATSVYSAVGPTDSKPQSEHSSNENLMVIANLYQELHGGPGLTPLSTKDGDLNHAAVLAAIADGTIGNFFKLEESRLATPVTATLKRVSVTPTGPLPSVGAETTPKPDEDETETASTASAAEKREPVLDSPESKKSARQGEVERRQSTKLPPTPTAADGTTAPKTTMTTPVRRKTVVIPKLKSIRSAAELLTACFNASIGNSNQIKPKGLEVLVRAFHQSITARTTNSAAVVASSRQLLLPGSGTDALLAAAASTARQTPLAAMALLAEIRHPTSRNQPMPAEDDEDVHHDEAETPSPSPVVKPPDPRKRFEDATIVIQSVCRGYVARWELSNRLVDQREEEERRQKRQAAAEAQLLARTQHRRELAQKQLDWERMEEERYKNSPHKHPQQQQPRHFPPLPSQRGGKSGDMTARRGTQNKISARGGPTAMPHTARARLSHHGSASDSLQPSPAPTRKRHSTVGPKQAPSLSTSALAKSEVNGGANKKRMSRVVVESTDRDRDRDVPGDEEKQRVSEHKPTEYKHGEDAPPQKESQKERASRPSLSAAALVSPVFPEKSPSPAPPQKSPRQPQPQQQRSQATTKGHTAETMRRPSSSGASPHTIVTPRKSLPPISSPVTNATPSRSAPATTTPAKPAPPEESMSPTAEMPTPAPLPGLTRTSSADRLSRLRRLVKYDFEDHIRKRARRKSGFGVSALGDDEADEFADTLGGGGGGREEARASYPPSHQTAVGGGGYLPPARPPPQFQHRSNESRRPPPPPASIAALSGAHHTHGPH